MEPAELSVSSRERRQMAAAIDYLVIFGTCFVVSAVGDLRSSQFWIAFAVIWFLVEVPRLRRAAGRSATS